MQEYLILEGYTSFDRTRWVKVSHDETVVWLPFASFCGSRPKAIQSLASCGIPIIGREAIKQFESRVSALCEFPEYPLIEQTGWTGAYYALADGVVVGPPNAPNATAVFAGASGKCHSAGSLFIWKRDVVRPLKDQHVVLFAIMMAFAATLLRFTERVGNIGFEISAPPGSGKTTVLQLASSVIGKPGRGADRQWWTSFDELFAASESEIDTHADALMALYGADLHFAGEPPRRRAAQFKTILSRLGAGRGAGNGAGFHACRRLIYLTCAASPLLTLSGHGSDVGSASAGRLITLKLSADRAHGVFESLPDGHLSSSSFTDALMAAASANHGVAMMQFLERLTAAAETDEVGLRNAIEKDLDYFRSRCGVDPDDGVAIRIADAFALVWVGGKLAREYGALPWKKKNAGSYCLEAALACYRLYRAGGAPPMPFSERLAAIAAGADTIHLRKGVTVPAKEMARAAAFVKETKSGLELWIRAEKIEKVFPDWTSIRNQQAVSEARKGDKTHHLSAKRSLSPGGARERFYVFKIPTPAIDSLGLTETDS